MSNIIETGIDYRRINDVKYMRSYLYRLNDDLRYMLNNIDLDNFSDEGRESYLEREDSASRLATSVESLKLTVENVTDDIAAMLTQTSDEIDLLVEKGDVTNQINISTEKIKLQASRLHVNSENFYLDDNILKIKGTIIANAGNIGGFVIAKDSSGRQYLEGQTGAALSSGVYQGTKGYFDTFKCNEEFFMYKTTAYMLNCQIQSTGLEMQGSFNTGSLYACKYSESTDQYSSWQQLNVRGGLTVNEDCHVGRNWDDSGTVTCYSIISSIDGERPGDYEDSDMLLKKDTEEISGEDALKIIMDSRPISFHYMDQAERQPGVIAQDVQELEARYGDYGIVDDSEDYLLVSYTRYIPIMTAALQEIDRILDGVRNGSIQRTDI